MCIEKHKNFIAEIHKHILFEANESISKESFKKNSDVVAEYSDLQAELERKFDELFKLVDSN